MPARAKSKAGLTISRGDTFAVKKGATPPAVRKTGVKITNAAPRAAEAIADHKELRAMLTDLGREINELSAGADRLLKRLA